MFSNPLISAPNAEIHRSVFGFCLRGAFSAALFILLAVVPGISPAFDQYAVDSLTNALEQSREDSLKCNIFYGLWKQFVYEDRGKALYYARQQLKLAKKLNYKKGLCMAYFSLGNCFNKEGDYSKAISFSLAALKQSEIINDTTRFNEALNYYEKALKMAETVNDMNFLASTLMSVGYIYLNKDIYDKALYYFKQALIKYKKMNQKDNIALSLSNIGEIYKSQDSLFTALKYYSEALNILEKMENISEKDDLAFIYMVTGEVAGRMGNHLQALNYFNKSMIISEEISEKKKRKKEIYEKLAAEYERAGNFIKANEYNKLFIQVKDTLLNEEISRQVTEMQTKYETEKKEKEITLLTKDKQLQQAAINRQKIVIWSVMGGILLSVIIALLLYRGYWLKQRANIQLAQKNQTIVHQKEIIEQKNRDITDSIEYARYLQEAVMPDPKQLKILLPESFVFYKPKDIISGDFYWFCEKNRKIMLGACDCTGHGVPGALLSVLCNNLLFQAVFDHGKEEPGDILSEVNKNVLESLKKEGAAIQAEEGMDASLCVIDKNSDKILFAGANHLLTILNAGHLEEIRGDMTPVGGLTDKNFRFTSHYIPVNGNTELFLSTDGYHSQFGGPKSKKLNRSGFRQIIKKAAVNPMEMREKILEEEFNNWKGPSEQVDDVLVVGFHHRSINLIRESLLP
ncbi:MAG: SpoIIE family protein phosphatase [Bacteroidetes bacterium]|nr:SpoIIE family protein phosphatase [Bacteroidota bacterium]